MLPWIICLLAALFYSYDFLLRVTPSVMIHPLMAEYSVNTTQIGLLSAFYYYAYTPLQLPSGLIVDKYNPRWVLSVSALCCTLGTFLFALTDYLVVAYVARAMMGIGSAFAFVGALKLAALWLPEQFALFSGITTALGTLGAMATDTILSYMVAHAGWRNAVYYSAFAGLLLTLLLFLLVRDKPQSEKIITDDGYYHWSSLTYRLFCLFMNWRFCFTGLVGACLFLPISVFASLWGVAFIAERFDISTANAASMTSLIFLGMAVSGPLMGWLSDKIQNRSVFLFAGSFFVLLFSALLIYKENIPFIWICPLLFLIGFSVGPQILTFAIAKEISPLGSTGLATAATNFIVTIGAAIFQPLIGYFLEQTWDGRLTTMGTPYYDVSNYREAFTVFMIFLALSFAMTFFIPKNTCKS
ncbi:MFS transporter [Legionella israelensis]|uniref:Lysosomal dipeptide transporter MFSD1 n=1 Tax=Legionella israelensis TaxID=454 RepID=A0AAX1EJZ8_9GAMM|nr:MFS transporter [Legionella israelensis]